MTQFQINIYREPNTMSAQSTNS